MFKTILGILLVGTLGACTVEVPQSTPSTQLEQPETAGVVEPIDPMEAALKEVKEGVYVSKWCNVVRRGSRTVGLDIALTVWADTLNNTEVGTTGRVWVDVARKYDLGPTALAEAFYKRYC